MTNNNSNNNSNRYVDNYVQSNSTVDPAPLLVRLTIGYLVLLVLLLYPLTLVVRKLRKQRKIMSASARKLQNDDDHKGVLNRMISMVMAMITSWTKMKKLVASVARRTRSVAQKMSIRIIRPIRLPESFGPRVVLLASPGNASDGAQSAACLDASIPSRFVAYNGAFAARRGNARRKNYNATRLAAFSVPLHEAGHDGDQSPTLLYRSYSDDKSTIINDGSFEEDEMVGHGAYDDYEWRDLPDNIRNAATLLGYCETSWDEGQDIATSLKNWDELASNEMTAAVTLGYNEKFWNSCKKRNHQDESLDANQQNVAIKGRDTLWAVLRFDKESREIAKIAFPTTMETMVEAVLGALQLAAISKYLGSDALAVFGVVNLAMIFTETFGAGIEAAEEVMVAQSIGSGDYYRAGSVVQLSVCLYMLLAIPVYSFWIYFIHDFALYFELGDDVARLAKAYVPVMSL